MTVKRFVEVGDNSGTDVMVPDQSAIVNTLDAGAHSSENAKFVSSKRKLFALNIRHFQFQIFDQVVVNQGSWWSRKERRDKNSKWSSTAAEDVFFFIVHIAIIVANQILWLKEVGRFLNKIFQPAK